MNGKDWHKQLSIGLVCLVLGFGITLQLRSVTLRDIVNNRGGDRLAVITQMLDEERTKNAELSKQSIQLKNDMDSLRDKISKNGDLTNALVQQLTTSEMQAGLVEVQGMGVSVTLTDANVNTANYPNSGSENFIIHDADVRTVVNELLSAGAEAVSLNDERLIATSSIRCVGPTVIVNNTRKSTPFVLKAVGEPATLEAGLNIKGGIVDILRQWGIGVEIKRSDKINIPAYKGNFNFKYATKVENTKAGGGQ